MSNAATIVQEILFDMFDLRENNKDRRIAGFEEFSTLHEFLADQIAKLEALEAIVEAGSAA